MPEREPVPAHGPSHVPSAPERAFLFPGTSATASLSIRELLLKHMLVVGPRGSSKTLRVVLQGTESRAPGAPPEA